MCQNRRNETRWTAGMQFRRIRIVSMEPHPRFGGGLFGRKAEKWLCSVERLGTNYTDVRSENSLLVKW